MTEKPITPVTQPPLGQRFSHVYFDRGEPTADSQRMRHRVGVLIYDFKELNDRLGSEIQRRIGIDIGRQRWPDCLKNVQLRDFLDIITVAYGLLAPLASWGSPEPRQWLSGVQQIFKEENVKYRMDAEGGVHFYVDKEFAFGNAATIAALQAARYANARHAFESGQEALSKGPPDGKGAIRETFGALARGGFPLDVSEGTQTRWGRDCSSSWAIAPKGVRERRCGVEDVA